MDKLRSYFNALPLHERHDFCRRCGTTIGYLRKAMSVGQIGPKLAAAIELHTNGFVTREDLRPDIFGPIPLLDGDSSPSKHSSDAPADPAESCP